jgi:hypothetical protein
MNGVGLFVGLEAKPGKEEEVAQFLEGALPLVQQEPQTTAWFRAASCPFPVCDLRHIPRRGRPGRPSLRAGCCRADGAGT